ncbi:MAG: hypothetical protein HRU14_08390 [Planctomycetes bacterium]|nr:hypothetical protein [Planctomycetota bacterium]
MNGAASTVVVLGFLALLGAGAYWLLRSDEAVDERSDGPAPPLVKSHENPEPESPRGVPTRAFDPKAEAVELPTGQRVIVRQARSMLGDRVPSSFANTVLEPGVFDRAGDRVEADWRRVLAIRSDFQKAARVRAQAVLDAGGYREWEARRIRVPDPDAPGRMVERLSTPYDGQREDEYILAIAATQSGRRLRHVVRLVPESDVVYAKLYREKQRREQAVHEELLSWFGANLR